MEKPKLLIIESAPAGGKSSVSRYIREHLPNTTLLDLGSLSHDTVVSSYLYHVSILNLFFDLRSTGSNIVSSRSFITNEVYYRLGKKDYINTANYHYLCEKLSLLTVYYDVTVVILATNRDEYEKRLIERGKKTEYIKYSADESMKQQRIYLEIADELREKGIHVIMINNTGTSVEQSADLIIDMISD